MTFFRCHSISFTGVLIELKVKISPNSQKATLPPRTKQRLCWVSSQIGTTSGKAASVLILAEHCSTAPLSAALILCCCRKKVMKSFIIVVYYQKVCYFLHLTSHYLVLLQYSSTNYKYKALKHFLSVTNITTVFSL